ncbi:thioredoxin family protein [Ilumatobacter sp.]|uniref:thioredoxin family protein n=1 Tax=Ilumatobacter sp. TaxID=1967498 RepID=UPI003B53023E
MTDTTTRGTGTSDAADTADTASRPELADGLAVVVKRDCETCRMIVPVLAQLDARATLTVYTQDDPGFPGEPRAVADTDLAVSWHHGIETVPTLIRVADGSEVGRTVGWSRESWESVSGVDDLGADLPAVRPGCGSLSVDPDLVDELRARFGASTLRSRRVEVAAAEDVMEMTFTRGWTDGLPVVPPTEERVLAMLEGTSRDPGEVVASVPPDLDEVTVEKVAVSAVMAGCRPEYLPWVLTAVEAACNDEFNMHGVLCTTMPVGPVVVCSGPGTRAIGMNSGGNALGQGNRANLTIGRALQLCVRNFGGGRPGEIDRSTHGSPGKISFCFAEADDTSPYGTLAGEHGIEPGTDALTVFAGESPQGFVDQLSREPDSLARSMATRLLSVQHPKLIMAFDAILVVGPEHARVYAEAGWGRERIVEEISSHLARPGSDLVRGAHGIAEGVPERFADAESLPKFRPGGLLLAHAGGGAGLFSQIIAGWANGATGSEPTTRAVRY